MSSINVVPFSVIQHVDEPSLALRVNQRIAGEVLKVAGDQVHLVLEGVHVVARLTSPNQTAALAARKLIQFIVRDISGRRITLQLLATPSEAEVKRSNKTSKLLPDLLRHTGIEATEDNLILAKALLSNGLPVNQELISELQRALQQHHIWSEYDAELAAKLKARGLPLSAESLALLQKEKKRLGEDVGRLQAKLETFLSEDAPRGISALVREALALLQETTVSVSSEMQSLPDRIKSATDLLGRSLERELLMGGVKTRGSSTSGWKPSGLLTLVHLQRELQAYGELDLAAEIQNLMDGLGQTHLVNAKPDVAITPQPWLEVNIPLVDEGAGEYPCHLTARTRIAYKPEGDERTIDPRHTHLIVEVEVAEKEVIEVDLSVLGDRIGAGVVTSTPGLMRIAEEERPLLELGLQGLGFTVQFFKCHVQPTRGEDKVADMGIAIDRSEIDREV